MLARETVGRLREATSDEINEEIRQDIDARVHRLAQAGEAEIDRRLEELDREWDIERTLLTNAAALSLVGLGLSLLDRRWLILNGLVGGFLLQHGLQGWCPPLPVFRRMGVRAAHEIEEERYALRAARGDFDRMGTTIDADSRAKAALRSVRRGSSEGRNR